MTHFFRGSTHPTGFQQAIEKATDGNQPSEDWSLIMNICDHVGSHEESAKEAMKIIRKRLQIYSSNNGWRGIGYTLSLLEALAKNCGKNFHLQIAHKDFLKELKGVIGPKNNPPVPIQERVLGLIQTWALAFRQDPDLKNVEHFYQECKQHGLVFPPPESDNFIKTAVPATGTIERPSQYTRPTSQTATSDEPSRPATARTMSAEQVAKLRSELDVVQTNAQVFGEMLVTLQPGEEDPQDFELLMELHNTCKQMQARIIDLLSQVSIDDITVDLLRYNDEFNNSFKTFESYMQERDRRFTSSHMPKLNQTTSSSTTKPLPTANNADNEPSLIKFDDEPVTLTSNFQNMRITQPPSTTYMNLNSTYEPIRSTTNNQDPESDVKEVEQWLKFQGDDDSDNEEQFRQEGGTTAAFNNFLQKRASTIPPEPRSDQQMYPNLQSNNHM